MEVTDSNGELIAWFSDDPDDCNSFSDYEYRLKDLITAYNAKAAAMSQPILGYLNLDQLWLLSELRPQTVPALMGELNEIKYWARCRRGSCHPDDPAEGNPYTEDGSPFLCNEDYAKYGISDEQCMSSLWWENYYRNCGLLDYAKTLND